MKPIDFQQANNLSTAQFIEHMQRRFPKYCKASNSMANNAEEYGVALSSKAVKYLNGKPAEKRTRPNQLTVRLLDADKSAFDRARLKRKHTIQQATEEAIMLYIKESEKE